MDGRRVLRRKPALASALMPWVVGLAAFAAYLHGLLPSLGPHDAAALAAGLRGWGVPHPPGFPLWSVSARLLGTALPFGDWTYRANLASAVLAAGAVALLAAAGRRLAGSATGAATAALLAGTTPAWWRRAVGAEVFAGATLVAAASIWLIARARDGEIPPGRALALAGLLSGIGLAQQPVLLLMCPGFAVMAWGASPATARAVPGWGAMPRSRWILAGALAMAGLALYFTLPVRALADTRMNWGAPSTASAWRDHVLRREFGTASFSPAAAEPLTPRLASRLAGAYAAALSEAFTPLGVVLGLAGAVVWYRRERWLAAGALIAALGSGLGFLLLARVAPAPDRWVVMEKHLMASLVPAGLLVVAGLATLSRARPGLALGLAVVGLCLGGRRAVGLGDRNLFVFHDFAENTFRSLPAHAVAVTTGDTAAFALWARQAAGRRTDVAVVWTVMPPWRARQVSFREPDLAAADLGSPGWLGRLPEAAARAGRPVYEVGDAPWPEHAVPSRHIAGYAMRVERGQSVSLNSPRSAANALGPLAVRRPPTSTRGVRDAAVQETITVESVYWGRLGMAAAAKRDWPLARKALERAAWLDPFSPTAGHNLRVLSMRTLSVKL